MGVERAVTRWYIQRQIILDEIGTLQAKLNDAQFKEQEVVESDTVVTADTVITIATDVVVTSNTPAQTTEEYIQQLAQAEEKLLVLGVCPRPMMG